MRTFIAIALPPKIKEFLRSIQSQLKASNADVKWVSPDNIHITLKFIGELNNKKMDAIMQSLDETAKEKRPFSIRLSSLGAFPKTDYPRVIWAGIDKGDKEVKEIAASLEERIARIGIPKEDREFSSHMTIGRVRSNLNRDKLIHSLKTISLGKEDTGCLEFEARNITLFKSTLTPQGPVYESLKDSSFRTS